MEGNKRAEHTHAHTHIAFLCYRRPLLAKLQRHMWVRSEKGVGLCFQPWRDLSNDHITCVSSLTGDKKIRKRDLFSLEKNYPIVDFIYLPLNLQITLCFRGAEIFNSIQIKTLTFRLRAFKKKGIRETNSQYYIKLLLLLKIPNKNQTRSHCFSH